MQEFLYLEMFGLTMMLFKDYITPALDYQSVRFYERLFAQPALATIRMDDFPSSVMGSLTTIIFDNIIKDLAVGREFFLTHTVNGPHVRQGNGFNISHLD